MLAKSSCASSSNKSSKLSSLLALCFILNPLFTLWLARYFRAIFPSLIGLIPSFLGLPGPRRAEKDNLPKGLLVIEEFPKKEPVPKRPDAQELCGEEGSSTPCGGDEVDDVGVDAGPNNKH